MDKLVFLLLFIPAFVHGQNCDWNSINTCSTAMANATSQSQGNVQALCRAFEEYKMCITRVAGCDGASIISSVEQQMLKSGANMTALCTGMVTTRAPSDCVGAIDMCTNSLMMVMDVASGDKNKICPAAERTVSCLNALMACVDQPAFTQARTMIEDQLKLLDLCPMLAQFPIISSATTCRSVPLLAVLTFILGHILA